MDHTLTEQQLEELRPLAAVIEGAIIDTPIRLGTDDWGTMLASAILVRVAAYMGGVLPPVAEVGDWLMRGTRDLSIPENARTANEIADRAAEEEQTLRLLRRESLLVLLTRLQRGRTLSGTEADTLRQHVETEIREADTARSVARSNLRNCKTLSHDLDVTTADLETADRIRAEAQRDRDQHAAVLAEVLATFVHKVEGYRIPRVRSGEVDVVTLEKWRSVVAPTAERPWWVDVAEIRAELEQAQAAIKRVRFVVDDGPPAGTAPGGEWEGGWDSAMDAARAALDGAEQPTTEG